MPDETHQDRGVLITERRVWTGLQKLTVTGLGVLLAAGTTLAGASFSIQVETREELRDLQESDRLQDGRLAKIEQDPGVTRDELARSISDIIKLQTETIHAFRENTAVLAEVRETMARVDENQKADRRDIDRMMREKL